MEYDGAHAMPPAGSKLRRWRRNAKFSMSSRVTTSPVTSRAGACCGGIRLRSSRGLILLLVALPAGYLYCDYTSHFESTDDAFIAARQFAIAPKVPGYLTAAPVTNNEHVAAGQVIAQIDQRDYRNALAVAKAQVAAAQASIETIDAQIVVQQAQINTNEAQVDQAQAALVFAHLQAKRCHDLAATAIACTV